MQGSESFHETLPVAAEVSDPPLPCNCCVHKFEAPSGILLSGPSQSGKTHLASSIIRNRRHLFSSVPREIIFVYSCWQSNYDELQSALGDAITFRSDIPSREQLQDLFNQHDEDFHRLLILDDQFCLFKKGPLGEYLIELASVLIHHLNISTIYITQSLYHGPIQREIGLNCQYLIIFRNPRSRQQIRLLATQIFGAGEASYFMEAYKKAVEHTRHGYLLLDLHQKTDQKMRLKSRILPSEDLIVYLPNM